MNKIFIMIFSIAIIFAAASSIFAYGHYGRQGYRESYGDRNYRCGSHMNEGYYSKRGYRGSHYSGYNRGYYNNMSESDRVELQKIDEKYYSQIQTLRNEIYTQNLNIRNEMYKDNPDQNKINQMIEEQTKSQAALQKLMSEREIETRKIINK